MTADEDLKTGLSVRLAARTKALTAQTSGLAPSYLQANLLVLPQRYSADFRLLCARNPVPCPLLAESASPGEFRKLISHIAATTSSEKPSSATSSTTTTTTTAPLMLPVAADIDIRHDFPAYRIYVDGVPSSDTKTDIASEWKPDDHVAFLIGCSYSFEDALSAAGLPPRHTLQGRNVPMYRTGVPLMPAGVFVGATMVVSMRPYPSRRVARVREVTRRFGLTHGEPVAWGWDAVGRLGIRDIAKPEFGDGPRRLLLLRGGGSEEEEEMLFGPGEMDEEMDEYVPVFWGCGVTPQEAVRQAGLKGTVMAHAPGHMVVLDLMSHEVFPE